MKAKASTEQWVVTTHAEAGRRKPNQFKTEMGEHGFVVRA